MSIWRLYHDGLKCYRRGYEDRGAILNSQIEPATLRAYQETDYRVFGDAPATLHVGVWCSELATLHARYQTDCSVFITACNPQGQRLDDASNARLVQALRAELSDLGLIALPGSGRHPTGTWPSEASYLVLGMTRARAQELGRKYRQNAVVWAGPDAVPQLLLLR